jgi:ribose/xylose/arabinose/galactoside ABC-type transport system permease subunit
MSDSMAGAVITVTGARRRGGQRREAVLAAALVVLVTGITLFRHDFLRAENLRDILDGAAPAAVAAAGMTALIVCAEIDISVGSVLAVCAVAAALLAKHGWPMPAVAAGSILAGAALGALNGWLVAGCGVPSIVATLATMGGLRGAMIWWTGGDWVRDLPPSFMAMSSRSFLGLPATVWIAAVVVTGMALLLARTRTGRQPYAVGSNRRSAELSGVRVRWVVFRTFVMLGALVGLAAILYASRFSVVQTDAGQGFELLVITAVVVGGTNIFGGQGTVLGSVLGVLLLSVIGPALTFVQKLTGITAEWEPAVQGVLILAAVLWDSSSRREA